MDFVQAIMLHEWNIGCLHGFIISANEASRVISIIGACMVLLYQLMKLLGLYQ